MLATYTTIEVRTACSAPRALRWAHAQTSGRDACQSGSACACAETASHTPLVGPSISCCSPPLLPLRDTLPQVLKTAWFQNTVLFILRTNATRATLSNGYGTADALRAMLRSTIATLHEHNGLTKDPATLAEQRDFLKGDQQQQDASRSPPVQATPAPSRRPATCPQHPHPASHQPHPPRPPSNTH